MLLLKFDTCNNVCMSTENNLNTRGLTFDESKFKIRSRAIIGKPQIPSVIRIMVSGKIVKTEKQAIGIVLVIVAALIGLSIFMYKKYASIPPATVNPALVTYKN